MTLPGIDLPALGNANSWLENASKYGYQTGTEPRVNFIVCWNDGLWGHVAYVTAVNGGSFTYDEGGSADRRRQDTVNGIYTGHPYPDGYTAKPSGFIYLGGSASQPAAPAAPSCSHTFLYRVESSHPHRTYQVCIDCEYQQYTGSGSYSASCADCNAVCGHSYLNCVEQEHPHRSYLYCIDCGETEYVNDGSYLSSCAACNPKTHWSSWSSWSTSVPAHAANREVEKREVVDGYNLVVYVTQEANYPYTRNFRNYSVNGNYTAYGLRSSYGEFSYSRYATKAELDAAAVCCQGTYVYQDSANVGGRYQGNGNAYYFPDGYYWYVENPVTRIEYRFRDQVTTS